MTKPLTHYKLRVPLAAPAPLFRSKILMFAQWGSGGIPVVLPVTNNEQAHLLTPFSRHYFFPA
jgi:hypothetical protein